jgi:hypothetical protein
MKGALIALFISIVVLVLFGLAEDVRFTASSVDVHIHDTYFVLDYPFFVCFLLVYMGTLLSIGGLISTNFKGKVYWMLLVVFILLVSFYTFNFFNVFNVLNFGN